MRRALNRLLPHWCTEFFGTTRAGVMRKDRGSAVAEDKSNPNLHVIERRKDGRRILVQTPVEVAKTGGEGKPITERTFIEDVSDFGCRFSTRGPVQKGDTVAVKILGSNGKALPDEESRFYEIMWVAPNSHGFTVGARLHQGEKLASVMHPPEPRP